MTSRPDSVGNTLDTIRSWIRLRYLDLELNIEQLFSRNCCMVYKLPTFKFQKQVSRDRLTKIYTSLELDLRNVRQIAYHGEFWSEPRWQHLLDRVTRSQFYMCNRFVASSDGHVMIEVPTLEPTTHTKYDLWRHNPTLVDHRKKTTWMVKMPQRLNWGSQGVHTLTILPYPLVPQSSRRRLSCVQRWETANTWLLKLVLWSEEGEITLFRPFV